MMPASATVHAFRRFSSAVFLFFFLVLGLASAASIDSWELINPVLGTGELQRVIHGDRWVVVGDGGLIGTSPDGRRWTRQVSPSIEDLRAVAFGGGKYIAAGHNGLVLTSTNATDWKVARAAEADTEMMASDAAYGNGLYVVVHDAGVVLTSGDGLSWTRTQVTLPDRRCVLRSIAFANGTFVAVGDLALIFTSTDGRTWTRRGETLFPNSDPGSTGFTAVTYGNGQFVAVTSNAHIATSSDGVTWTDRTPETGSDTLTSVAGGDGRFLIGTSLYGGYYFSSDAVTWTKEEVPVTALNTLRYTDLAFANGIFVAVGPEGKIAVKTATAEWTLVTGFAGVGEPAGLAFGNGRLVVTGWGGGSITSADDGYTWTTETSNGYGRSRVGYGAGVFATGSTYPSTPGVYVSGDGSTWTLRPMTGELAAITYAQGKFVGVGYQITATSSDGTTWTSRTAPSGQSYAGVASGNNRFVAVGYSGAIATSPDGVTWTAQPAPTTAHFSAVAYGTDRFVAIERDAVRLWSSSDGVSWSALSPPATPAGGFSTLGGFSDIIYASGRFVAVFGSDIVTSTDGVSWTVIPHGLSTEKHPLFFLTYGNGRFFAAGRNGQIFRTAADASGLEITALSPDALVSSGGRATLSVTATGTNLRYQWYRGASGDTSAPIAGATTAQLTTSPLTAATQFWVRVSNDTSAVNSTTISVLLTAPARVVTPVTEFEVIGGTPLALTTEVTGTPTPVVQWYRGKRGDVSQPVPTGTGAVLTIVPDDTIETYWMRASNSGGTADSDEIRVTPWRPLHRVPPLANARVIGGVLVGVGVEEVDISSDGATWTKVAEIRNSYLRDIAEGAGLFVAVGDRGFYSSPDLVTWTQRNTASLNGAQSLARGNRVFVAAGFTSYSSTNGIDWSAITLPAGVHFASVIFDGTRFVAAGSSTENGNLNRQDIGAIFTSEDGRSWTRRGLGALPENAANANTAFDRITFAGNRYIATGGNTTTALVSADGGANWTRIEIDSQLGGRIRSIAYHRGRFVMATTAAFYVSLDAITWSAFAAPTEGIYPFLFATPEGELLVFEDGPYSYRGVFRLEDTLEWTVLAGLPDQSATGLSAVANGAGQALGIGFDGLYAADDPQRWSPVGPQFAASSSAAIAYANGRYVVPSSRTSSTVLVSRDGRRWAAHPIGDGTTSFSRIVAAGDRFFGFAGGIVGSSTDGESWSISAPTGIEGLTDVAFGNGVYVLVGFGTSGPTVAYSTNGTSWTIPASAPAATGLEGVAYGAGKFLAVGRNFQDVIVLTSADGRTWTSHPWPLPETQGLQDVIFSVDRFFTITSDRIAFSFDGTSWQWGPSDASDIFPLFNFRGAVMAGTRLVRALDPRTTAVRSITSDVEVDAGQTTKLVVSASGTGLSYQWYEGSAGDLASPVAGATQATFTTPPVTAMRNYWVRVQGSAGTADSAAVLVTPASAPRFTTNLYPSDTIEPTNDAVLRVAAESVSPVTYQWFLGASGDTSSPIPAANGPTLVMPSTATGGRFWVRATNAHGNTDSPAALATRWAAAGAPSMPLGETFGTKAVVYGAGKFVVVGASQRYDGTVTGGTATSANASDWTFNAGPRLADAAFGNGRFVAVGDFGNTQTIYSSTDGTTWSSVYTETGGTSFTKIFFIGGRFLALSRSGQIASSSDGASWTLTNVATASLVSAAYGNSTYVIAASGGRLYTSADSSTWTQRTSGVSANFSGVAFGNGRFIAVASDGSSVSSTNGSNWTPLTPDTWDGSNRFAPESVILFVNDRFFVSAPTGYAYALTSSDGLSWGPSLPFADLAYGADRFVRLLGSIYRSLPQPSLGFVITPQTISANAGENVRFTGLATADSAVTYQWRRNGTPLTAGDRFQGVQSPTLAITAVAASDAGNYDVVVTKGSDTITSPAAQLLVVTPPTITAQPAAKSGAAGSTVTLSAAATTTGGSPGYRWQLNGESVPDATALTLTLANLQPSSAGLYRAAISDGVTSTTTQPAIVGLTSTTKIVGAGKEVGENLVHPNGNTFDQVLLTGAAESVTADYAEGQITRTSFVDLDGDIVQVEFSGPGTLSLVLASSSGPAAAENYNQPSVAYMKGHASIVITGADEHTNVSVFTVGRVTAFDPTGSFNFLQPISSNNDPSKNGNPIFTGHENTDYDGIADIAFIAIASRNGKFGSVRTSNTHYFGSAGYVGLYAPNVAFQGPVLIGDITAFDAATPVIFLGAATDTRIAGGDLLQANGQPVLVSGITQLNFTAGTDSHGRTLDAQTNRAVYMQDGIDVTAQIVAKPTP